MQPVIKVIIPAFNEEDSIALVIREIPHDIVDEVIVVSNGSTDNTERNAREAGATVLQEPSRGYGRACLKGIAYLEHRKPSPDIVVFLDGDFSDDPRELRKLVEPLQNNSADLVIGSRTLGHREAGSMTPQQIFGNWLATRLLKLLYGVKFTDLGPFRSIKYSSLLELDMKDKTYGWTVEMQLKAAKKKLRSVEIPVRYKKRIGYSKISGTLKGSVMAGYKILHTVFKYI